MTRSGLLETAHGIVRACLRPGDVAIDATLGNGYDTLFLAECVGSGGHVFGFDIQTQALANTAQRLREAGLANRVTLFAANHADMLAYIPENPRGEIKAVMFNLGYLPGGDKTLVTQAGSTLAAIDAALRLLARRGTVSVLAYPGHAGGEEEVNELDQHLRMLQHQARFGFECIFSQYHQSKAPRLFIIRKF